jgi:hypothetical protein
MHGEIRMTLNLISSCFIEYRKKNAFCNGYAENGFGNIPIGIYRVANY